jgi:hypothetical protein
VEHDVELETGGMVGPEAFSSFSSAIEQMLGDGFLDGLVLLYEQQFSTFKPMVEDVVFDQVAILAKKAQLGKEIEDPRACLVWYVKRRLLDLTRRPPPRYGAEADYVDPAESPEAIAIRQGLYEYVKSLLDRWPNKQMAIVTRLFLDAAYYGEPLSVGEAQGILADDFDYNLSTDNIRQLKSRGLGRLTEQFSI